MMTDMELQSDLDDIKQILKTEAGRRFVWRIIRPVLEPSFCADNQFLTAKLEGERSVGLWVMERINMACPDRFIQMQREDKLRQEQKANERRISDE